MSKESDFFEKVKIIFNLACKYGVDTVRIETSSNMNHHSLNKFIQACHEGFALAQDQILDGLINCEKELAKLLAERKTSLIKRDKEGSEALLQRIRFSEYQAQILRKLADSIAWQMVFGDHYIIRRLFLYERSPSLLSAGLFETKTQVDKLNLGKQGFALISDITSFI